MGNERAACFPNDGGGVVGRGAGGMAGMTGSPEMAEGAVEDSRCGAAAGCWWAV